MQLYSVKFICVKTTSALAELQFAQCSISIISFSLVSQKEPILNFCLQKFQRKVLDKLLLLEGVPLTG